MFLGNLVIKKLVRVDYKEVLSTFLNAFRIFQLATWKVSIFAKPNWLVQSVISLWNGMNWHIFDSEGDPSTVASGLLGLHYISPKYPMEPDNKMTGGIERAFLPNFTIFLTPLCCRDGNSFSLLFMRHHTYSRNSLNISWIAVSWVCPAVIHDASFYYVSLYWASQILHFSQTERGPSASRRNMTLYCDTLLW